MIMINLNKPGFIAGIMTAAIVYKLLIICQDVDKI
jgi:hypothetical protein